MAYSRHGYGGSGPARLPRPASFMHTEALDVLPEILDRLGLSSVILVGHSDGASIAQIAAGQQAVPVSPVGVLAPHVAVEEQCLEAIARIRRDYLASGELRTRLARHHRDPDASFWGWNDVWLSEEFRSWSIEDVLPGIDVPVVAVQGLDDQYGTVFHVDAIEHSIVGGYAGHELADVGHAPHAERPAETLAALTATLATLP